MKVVWQLNRLFRRLENSIVLAGDLEAEAEQLPPGYALVQDTLCQADR